MGMESRVRLVSVIWRWRRLTYPLCSGGVEESEVGYVMSSKVRVKFLKFATIVIV